MEAVWELDLVGPLGRAGGRWQPLDIRGFDGLKGTEIPHRKGKRKQKGDRWVLRRVSVCIGMAYLTPWGSLQAINFPGTGLFFEGNPQQGVGEGKKRKRRERKKADGRRCSWMHRRCALWSPWGDRSKVGHAQLEEGGHTPTAEGCRGTLRAPGLPGSSG